MTVTANVTMIVSATDADSPAQRATTPTTPAAANARATTSTAPAMATSAAVEWPPQLRRLPWMMTPLVLSQIRNSDVRWPSDNRLEPRSPGTTTTAD